MGCLYQTHPLKAQDVSEEEVGRWEESEMTNDTKETVSSGNNSINTNSQRLCSMNKAYMCSRQAEHQHQEGEADTESHPNQEVGFLQWCISTLQGRLHIQELPNTDSTLLGLFLFCFYFVLFYRFWVCLVFISFVFCFVFHFFVCFERQKGHEDEYAEKWGGTEKSWDREEHN